jgi:hypothetical protein
MRVTLALTSLFGLVMANPLPEPQLTIPIPSMGTLTLPFTLSLPTGVLPIPTDAPELPRAVATSGLVSLLPSSPCPAPYVQLNCGIATPGTLDCTAGKGELSKEIHCCFTCISILWNFMLVMLSASNTDELRLRHRHYAFLLHLLFQCCC